ncbi:MAG: HEAT repeat domain-containing protein [Alphaproteobacteria bacterium]|nr:HEAT repeat domain-containing protein [Alphaproteobacteria bacterium]
MQGLRVAWLALALLACAPRLRLAVDPSLGDGAPLARGEPLAALEAAATDADPSTRRRAFEALLDALPVERLTRWAVQGSYDRDPWVQTGVVDALLQRVGEPGVPALLLDVASRGSADPYARAAAAHGLLDAGHADGLEPLRTAWVDRPGWKAAPLALVAVRLGEQAGRPVLERALREGDVRDDPSFVVALGLHGWPGLVDALARDDAWAEEDLGLRLDVARALLADPAGARAWRAALADREPAVAREAFELVLRLAEGPQRATWLGAAARAGDRGVRRAATAWRRPQTLARSWASGEAYTREALLPLLLGDEDGLARLAEALEADDPSLRAAAARRASRLRAVSLRPLLEVAATDDRVEVRLAALGALLAR